MVAIIKITATLARIAKPMNYNVMFFLSRPYYEALEVMCVAQAECQKAAVQFQRAAGNNKLIPNLQGF